MLRGCPACCQDLDEIWITLRDATDEMLRHAERDGPGDVTAVNPASLKSKKISRQATVPHTLYLDLIPHYVKLLSSQILAFLSPRADTGSRRFLFHAEQHGPVAGLDWFGIELRQRTKQRESISSESIGYSCPLKQYSDPQYNPAGVYFWQKKVASTMLGGTGYVSPRTPNRKGLGPLMCAVYTY